MTFAPKPIRLLSPLRRSTFSAAVSALVLAAVVAAQGPKEAGTSAPSDAAVASAKKIFATYCSTCHGTTGLGDGAAAAALNPKPRSFTDATWQRTVSDDHLTKVILEGGAAVKLSPLMAPSKAMFDPEPAGTIDAMVALVRELGKPKPISAAATKAAETIYTTYCATCHGAKGAGDGAAAAALTPKPRTFADGKWQKSVSDDHLIKVMLEGGAAVGLSPLMAPAKEMFKGQPEGTVEAAVQIVRKLGKAGDGKAKTDSPEKKS